MATLLPVDYLAYLWGMHQLWQSREKTQYSTCKQPGIIINVSVKMFIVVFLDTWTSCTLKSFPPLGWQTMWLILPLTTLFRRGLLWELLNSFLIYTSYWRHTDSEPEGSVASVAARLAQLVEHQTFNLRVKGSSPLLGKFPFFCVVKMLPIMFWPEGQWFKSLID